MLELKHRSDEHKFTLAINGEEAKVEYMIKEGKMYFLDSSNKRNSLLL
jgi:hypothetical protein